MNNWWQRINHNNPQPPGTPTAGQHAAALNERDTARFFATQFEQRCDQLTAINRQQTDLIANLELELAARDDHHAILTHLRKQIISQRARIQQLLAAIDMLQKGDR